jgi:ABC-type glycerol-3-phosphate transport system permease component
LQANYDLVRFYPKRQVTQISFSTRNCKCLIVYTVAQQGVFANDARGIATGVAMTVVPMIIFFALLQKQFIAGLTGAVKG